MGEIINFRDLGGIKTRDGRMVASKRLLRSGELVDLDQKDVEMLRTEYNLKHIFDFRDDGEVELSPDVVMEGVRYSHVDLMKDVELGSTSKRNLFQLYDREEKAVDQMRFIYQAIIRSQTARKGYHDFIQCVSGRKEGPLLCG